MPRSRETPPTRRQDDGFALLMVLWWTVLLALLATHLALAGRLEARRAFNLRDAAVAQALADDALQQTLFHLSDRSSNGWPPSDATYTLLLPGGSADVQIQSEAGKLGLNAASPALIAALLQRLGVGAHDAAALGDAVVDWRTSDQQARPLGAKEADYRAAGLGYGPPENNFETVDELAYVRGMTPVILAKLEPYVSVYQTDEPDPAVAAPALRQALSDIGQRADLMPDVTFQPVLDRVLALNVRVTLPDGSQALRRTMVRLTPNTPPAPYRILEQF